MAYTKKQKEDTMKYLEKLKEIRFRVKPDEYERYGQAAKKARSRESGLATTPPIKRS